jgi:hypothetical protein
LTIFGSRAFFFAMLALLSGWVRSAGGGYRTQQLIEIPSAEAPSAKRKLTPGRCLA